MRLRPLRAARRCVGDADARAAGPARSAARCSCSAGCCCRWSSSASTRPWTRPGSRCCRCPAARCVAGLFAAALVGRAGGGHADRDRRAGRSPRRSAGRLAAAGRGLGVVARPAAVRGAQPGGDQRVRHACCGPAGSATWRRCCSRCSAALLGPLQIADHRRGEPRPTGAGWPASPRWSAGRRSARRTRSASTSPQGRLGGRGGQAG